MTTPDYAGLIEELRELAKSCGYEYGTESGTTAWNAATALRTLLESNAALERERDYAVRWANRSVESVKEECFARIEELEAELAALTGPEGDMRDYHDGIVAALISRAEAAEARVQELEAENARLRERQAEADRVIDMVEEDPALARSLARSYRDKGRE